MKFGDVKVHTFPTHFPSKFRQVISFVLLQQRQTNRGVLTGHYKGELVCPPHVYLGQSLMQSSSVNASRASDELMTFSQPSKVTSFGLIPLNCFKQAFEIACTEGITVVARYNLNENSGSV